MPAKIGMVIHNGNFALPPQMRTTMNSINAMNSVNTPLNAGMIKRIHNVRPGCGSCGRKAS
jgi:hypothetical protein